nr:glycosyltransferase [Neisseria meningitidis]
MYFFPRFPFIDIDRIRWVRVGLKAFKHYIRENGLPDLIHAHRMNYAGILAQKISQKYGIPYVVTKHSSTITRGLIRPHQWQPMKNAAAHAAARLAISRHFAHVLQHKYGCEWQYLPNILGGIFNRPFEQREKTTNRISCSAPSRTFAVSKDTMSCSLPLPGRWHNARNCV